MENQPQEKPARMKTDAQGLIIEYRLERLQEIKGMCSEWLKLSNITYTYK